MQRNYPNRRSIRLHGYDYSQPGLYFVTICVQNHECLSGKITNDESPAVRTGLCPVRLIRMQLSPHGTIINEQWLNIPNRFPYVVLHEYVIMPNHFHAIIEIDSRDSRILQNSQDLRTGQSPVRTAIGNIIGAFKSITTKICNVMDNIPGRKIWHSRFYDHIIRNQRAYDHISQYIINNPARWRDDRFFRNENNE